MFGILFLFFSFRAQEVVFFFPVKPVRCFWGF